MTIKFEIRKANVDECSSVSSFVSSDYSLEVRLRYNFRTMSFAEKLDCGLRARHKRILLIFGNLTLTFSGDNLCLERIDSYTNNRNWIQGEVKLPAISDTAALNILPSNEDDRFSFDFEPVYIFDSNKSLLLVELSKNMATRFHRLADNLVIGMAEENLVSLVIENIKISNMDTGTGAAST